MNINFARGHTDSTFDREPTAQLSPNQELVERVNGTIEKVEVVAHNFRFAKKKKFLKITLGVLTIVLFGAIGAAIVTDGGHRHHRRGGRPHKDHGRPPMHRGPGMHAPPAPPVSKDPNFEGPLPGPDRRPPHPGKGPRQEPPRGPRGHHGQRAPQGPEDNNRDHRPPHHGDRHGHGHQKPGKHHHRHGRMSPEFKKFRKVWKPMKKEWMQANNKNMELWKKSGKKATFDSFLKKLNMTEEQFKKLKKFFRLPPHLQHMIKELKTKVLAPAPAQPDVPLVAKPVENKASYSPQEMASQVELQRQHDIAVIADLISKVKQSDIDAALNIVARRSKHHGRRRHRNKHRHHHGGPRPIEAIAFFLGFVWFLAFTALLIIKCKSNKAQERVSKFLTIENSTLYRQVGLIWSINDGMTTLTLTKVGGLQPFAGAQVHVAPENAPFAGVDPRAHAKQPQTHQEYNNVPQTDTSVNY